MATAESQAVGGLAFMVSFGEFFNIVSALNSSPWTAENFGGDPAKERSARRWVYESMAVGGTLGGVGTLLTRSWWPLAGVVSAGGYVWWCYDRALRKAREASSVGWSTPGNSNPKMKAWDWKGVR